MVINYEAISGWETLNDHSKNAIRQIIERDYPKKERVANSRSEDSEICQQNCDYDYDQTMESCSTLTDSGERAVCKAAAYDRKEKCHNQCRNMHGGTED